MIYFKRTRSGRVVYPRRTHHFSTRDSIRITDTVYNRIVNNQIYLWTEEKKAEERIRWKYLSEITASGLAAISRAMQDWQPGELVRMAESDHNIGLIVTLIDVYEALNKVINFIATYGGWIPYVGQAANAGVTILEMLKTLLGPMPAYYRDEYGRIQLYYP